MSVIVIEDWMIQERGLAGLDLLAFALVHGCTQKGEGCWYGGYDRLAERIGGKQRGTIMAINRLEEIGAVERFDAVIEGKAKGPSAHSGTLHKMQMHKMQMQRMQMHKMQSRLCKKGSYLLQKMQSDLIVIIYKLKRKYLLNQL